MSDEADKRARRVAFERAVVPHLGGLYRSARRFTLSVQDAEDLVQDAMLRAFRAFDEHRPPPNPKAWVHRILHNIAIDKARQRARHEAPLSVDDEGAGLYERLEAGKETGPFSDPSRLIDRWGDRELVREVCDGLPVWARQVLVLAVVEGFRYREIAETLGIPEGTVMSRLSRARKALERGMADRLRLPDPPAPRLPSVDERDSPRLRELKGRWGELPDAMRALAAAPPLLDAAARALETVIEDGALTAEVKRRIVAALDASPEQSDEPGSTGALIGFARRAAADPAGLTRADFDLLAGEGWTDAQVLEALHVASWAPYLMRMNAALGARAAGVASG